MHETSPGGVEKHELSITSDNKSELDGAKANANIDMELKSMKTDIVDDESDQRIYDDPCDLLDDVPIFRMSRSRSWFCCPSNEAACPATAQPHSIFYNRYPDYSLVTEPPRVQYATVGRPSLRVQFNFLSIMFFSPRAGGINWIYDIIETQYVFSIFRYKR